MYARLYNLGVADAVMETTVRIRKTDECGAVLDNLCTGVQEPKKMEDFEVTYFLNRVEWHQRLFCRSRNYIS
jgi:hypothetical protein